ncbi:MAG TPA: LLM class flavin-dependent oxidoreductase [Pseudomonadales bacterium]|nr:LLM class flavin-dependent oxidoreductase [Pseudomonadales bacterium]
MSDVLAGARAPLRIGTLGSDALLTGPVDARRDLAARLDGSGLDHLFIADHVSFHDGTGMDGLVDAAMLATLCPRMEICVGVYLLALRHPVPVARQIASIARSAPGRLVLGVGVGGEDRHEIEICGVDPTTRGRRTDHCLSALRGLLSGAATDHDCEFFSFEGAVIRPAPEPRVPILIGGRADAALRRAGVHGDGWLGVWTSAARFAGAVATVEAHARDAGRDGLCRAHGMQIWVGLDDDPERARARLARRMEGFYRTPWERFERYAPYGTPDAVAAALRPYLDAGCRRFNLMPVAGSEAEGIDGIREIAAALRAADAPRATA